MRAIELLQKNIAGSLNFVPQRRLDSLWAAVAGLINENRLTLTALGRAMAGDSQEKNGIKRADRLLGNTRLQLQAHQIYSEVSSYLLRSSRHPIVLVDWTPIANHREHHALVASTPVGGRALVLYAEVHLEKRLGAVEVHRRFLSKLSALLPAGCRPIVVTDAGFATSWFDLVEALGWHFVGRLRGRKKVRLAQNDDWVTLKSLNALGSSTPLDLGAVTVTESNPRARRMVLYKAPASKRKARPKRAAFKSRPKRDYSDTSDKPRPTERYRRSANEPWVLLTSLTEVKPQQVVKFYELRMQTEESFRDFKSHRFGFSFDDSGSKWSGRIEILILIAALAHLAVVLLGMAAENRGLHQQYQANTAKRRVLSFAFLGTRIANKRINPIAPEDFALALANVSLIVQSFWTG